MVRVPKVFSGRVGEWLKPADCKSAAPCGLRRFESFPVHQALVVGLQKTAGQPHERCSKAVQFGAQAPLRKSAPRKIAIGGETGWAWVAQLVERVLGKDEVTGSIPVPGSRIWRLRYRLTASGTAQNLRPCGKFGEAPGGGNSTVESHSSKVMVAGSNPVPRSRLLWIRETGIEELQSD